MAYETYPDVVLGRGNPLEYTITLRDNLPDRHDVF